MNALSDMASSSPLVTVVIPSFNRERWIGEAVQSALDQQTDFPVEIIVSDDGSTDDTVAVARSFGPNVRVLESALNRGAAAARNAAIKESTAPFIAFLDSDDRMLPGRLQTQIDFLEAHPKVGLVNAASVHEDGERAEDYYKNRGIDVPSGEWRILEHPRPIFIKQFFGAPSTTTIRRSLLEQIGLFDETIVSREDWELFFRAASKTAFGCYNSPLAWMRTTHEGRYGSSPRGAVREPFLLQHILDSVSDLTEEERVLLVRRYRAVIHNALRVSLLEYGSQELRSVYDEFGGLLQLSSRLKWRGLVLLPQATARELARRKLG